MARDRECETGVPKRLDLKATVSLVDIDVGRIVEDGREINRLSSVERRYDTEGRKVQISNGCSGRSTKSEADKAGSALHPDWESDNEHCFGPVIVDETQLLKSLAAQTSITLQ